RTPTSSFRFTSARLAHRFERMASLLDGTCPVEKILQSVDGRNRTLSHFVLKALRANGLLQEAEGSLQSVQLEDFLAKFTSDAAAAARDLRQIPITFAGSGELGEAIKRAAQRIPLKVGNLPGPSIPALVICAADSEEDITPDQVDEWAIRKGIRWLRVTLSGTGAFLGPTCIPQQTACYLCYMSRRRSTD